MTRNPAYGFFLVVMAAGLFVVNAGVSRVALRAGVEASTLTSIRVTGTLAILVVFALLFRQSALRLPRGKLAVLVVAHGLVGVAALQWLYFVAIERLPVGVALLLEYLAPILVALWARFVQHEAVSNRMWLGLGLALAGLAATTGIWNGLRFDGLGVIAGLGAACCFAAYFLIGEVGVNSYDPLQVVVWSFVVAAIMLNLVAPVTGLGPALGTDVTLLGRYAEHAVPLWGVLAWVVVLGTVIPFVAELLALQHLKATTVTTVAMLEPVGAVVLGWFWFSESLGLVAVIGCVAVVAGVLLAQTARPSAVLEPVAT